MAGKARYTDEEKDKVIEYAQIYGIRPAIRHFGYPSYTAVVNWFKERGLESPIVDSLMAKAAELKVFYSDNDKKAALQIAIDRIIEELEENAGLTADDINKLSNALAKLLQTFQLIEGKSTSVMEKVEKSETDKNIERLMGQMKKMNDRKEAELG